MKQTIAIALFAFIIHFSAFSQNNLSQVDTASILPDSLGKYELGVNTYFAFDRLLDQSVRNPLELLLRKHLSPNRMLRLRVFGDLQRSNKVEGNFTDDIHHSFYGLALGHEWIRPIHKRWQGYYGLELEGSLTRSFHTNTQMGYDPEADPYEFWEKTHTYQDTERLVLSPLAGIRFLLSKRLLFSTEFRLVNSLEWNKSGEEYATKPIEGGLDYQIQSQSESSINQRGIRFKPYTGIFIIYRF